VSWDPRGGGIFGDGGSSGAISDWRGRPVAILIGDLKLSKELKEKLIGLDREGLGLGLELGIWYRRSEPDRSPI